MGGRSIYCVLCGHPTDSTYADRNPYINDTAHMNEIVVLLKDGSFTDVASTYTDDSWGIVKLALLYTKPIPFLRVVLEMVFITQVEVTIIYLKLGG